MQIVGLVGQVGFIGLIYLFLLRVFTVLLKDLQAQSLGNAESSQLGCLEVLHGSESLPQGKKIKIDNRGLRIGRGKDNDIALTDQYCSLEHAQFKHKKGVTYLEDIGSTNGTWVNGERVQSQVQLVVGDFIKVGGTTFLYSRWRNENV